MCISCIIIPFWQCCIVIQELLALCVWFYRSSPGQLLQEQLANFRDSRRIPLVWQRRLDRRVELGADRPLVWQPLLGWAPKDRSGVE